MEILTKSIKDYLVEKFDKDISEIGYADILHIDSLTIDGKDEFNEKSPVSFNDIKIFKNLKYLEIRNTLITTSLISLLEDMPYLENLILRNCTIRKSVTTMNNLKKILQLRVNNCKNFSFELINELNLCNLTIENMQVQGFNYLKNNHINSLDISMAKLKNGNGLKKINIDQLVIKRKEYNKYKKILNNAKYSIIIMADKGYYIEIDLTKKD
ncbi:MAG: hypothetical protein IK997_00045 [Bacilli bacterium]|nr:hypothetical protein [Bacilli bacterium]